MKSSHYDTIIMDDIVGNGNAFQPGDKILVQRTNEMMRVIRAHGGTIAVCRTLLDLSSRGERAFRRALRQIEAVEEQAEAP